MNPPELISGPWTSASVDSELLTVDCELSTYEVHKRLSREIFCSSRSFTFASLTRAERG
jgi:hypothetical protein